MRFRTTLPFALLLPTLASGQHATRDSAAAIRVHQAVDSIALNAKLNLRSKRSLVRLDSLADTLTRRASTAFRVDTVRLVDTVYVTKDTTPASTNAAPVARFTASCTNLVCQVDGSASTDDRRVISWRWNWGDGRTEQHNVPTIQNTWGSAGTYTITLTAIDSAGLTNSTTRSVTLGAIVPDTAPTPPPAPVPDTTPPPPPVVVPPTGVIFSHPFGPPANGAILAELPRDTVDVSYPTITRRYPCTNLQACLDTAQTGDEVLLAPGANFRDATVKPTARTAWTVVRTNISDAQLGGPWTRMTKSRADALNLATIHTSGGAASAITVNSGAHHVRFVGVRIVPDATYTNALVRVGLGETTVAQLPHHITLDRVVIDGDTNSVQRCIAFDGDYLALLSSTLANCHAKSGDSQGVLQINGRGPTRIENNAIAAGHQMVFLGGGDPSIRGIVPADIVIRRNDLSRPLAWKGVWQEKTNIELKIGKRVLIEGNAICHTWPDAQDGHAILLKTENQGGGTWGDWSETSDVTVRYNLICGAGSGFNLAPLPGGPGIPMSRVTIYGNVADSLGVGPYNSGTGEAMLNQGVADVVYRDNWNRNVGRACLYLSGVSQRFAASGNVCSGQYGIFGEGTGVAGAAPGAVITGNTVLAPGTAWSSWPVIPVDSARDALLNGVQVAP